MNELVALTGHAGHGKDTIVRILSEDFGFTRISFADPVREMCLAVDPYCPLITEDTYSCSRLSFIVREFGWDEAKKNPIVREYLQRMGTEAVRNILGEHIWANLAMRKCAEVRRAAISDLRFPNEESAIKNNNGIIWRVERTGFVNSVGTSHASEAYSDKIKFDELIINDGTIENLRTKIHALVLNIWGWQYEGEANETELSA